MPKRILVAEDQPNLRSNVQKAVLEEGFECLAVCNGQEAVEAFNADSFDLIIMDLNMPEKGGFQATKEIRAIEAKKRLKPIPIIAFTSHGEEVMAQCLDCGMDDFASKCEGREYLVTKVRFLLGPA